MEQPENKLEQKTSDESLSVNKEPVIAPATTGKNNAVSNNLWRSLCIIVIPVFFVGGYLLGNTQGYASGKKAGQASMATNTELKVPAGATIVSQCEPGEGTQYIMPKDIPNGPVYNVWQNKVIGLEYMVGRDELVTDGKSYTNLPMMGVKYDHLNIGFVSHGHAGFPSPHYHIQLYTVPASQEAQITCGTTPSTMNHMHM